MYPSIRRIVFTGDVLRSSQGERSQLANVKWLYRRFSPILASVTGLEPEIRMAGSAPFVDAEPVIDLFRTMGEQPGIDAWARTFWATPSTDLIKKLEFDYSDSLVISIEISPILEGVLNAMSVPWIDIGISPLRFMPDFAVSFRTSGHFIGKFPESFKLSQNTIDDSVHHIKEYYANNRRRNLRDAIVLFAQTPSDRTLIKGNFFAGAEEAIIAIERARDGRPILIKPHPWAPNNTVVDLCQVAFKAEITDINTYEILSHPADIKVITISSSVGVEARAFGRPTIIEYPCVQSMAYEGPATMYHWRSSKLWAALLASVMSTRVIDDEPWQPNDLRKELGMFGIEEGVWG